MAKRNIKDLVQPGKMVTFVKYRRGNLYYTTDCGFLFPVPVSDLGDASCLATEKASMYMRYMRKHLEHDTELSYETKLTDLNIHDVGSIYQFSGVIYSGGGKTFLVGFPDEKLGEFPVEQLEMDRDEWKKFLKQTDHLEVEVQRANPENGEIVKAFVRKSTRQIEQNVSWNVYKRDKYTCRYCAREGIPLTVDHLVLWEHGGPSIEDNLNTACRACNKTRGNMLYADWLKSPYYKKVSKNLPADILQWNESIVEQLAYVPRHGQKKTR